MGELAACEGLREMCCHTATPHVGQMNSVRCEVDAQIDFGIEVYGTTDSILRLDAGKSALALEPFIRRIYWGHLWGHFGTKYPVNPAFLTPQTHVIVSYTLFSTLNALAV